LGVSEILNPLVELDSVPARRAFLFPFGDGIDLIPVLGLTGERLGVKLIPSVRHALTDVKASGFLQLRQLCLNGYMYCSGEVDFERCLA
jgi:hypothetical protein